MKKYTSLGALLTDFRNFSGISQADLGALLNVDIRTVIRWEKDETLIKTDKEEELVEITFIPYQVIRNLNASVAIPTFYDFSIRKYALSELSNDLPDADWFKSSIDVETKRIRSIHHETDIRNILRYTQHQYNTSKPIDPDLIRKAARLLPELNLILEDDAGFYAGHCVILPLKHETISKLRSRDIDEGGLTPGDLTNPWVESKSCFHGFDITADCNENVYYIIGFLLRYFRLHQQENYIYSAITSRYDSFTQVEQMGLKIVWEDEAAQHAQNLKAVVRYQEGNFNAFLNKK
jgi:transcriptional regulator with XRE-family HTH domain